MAKLTAFFQYDIDLFNLNWYVANFESQLLADNINDPWEDRYSIYTTDDAEAFVQHGSGYDYDGAGDMTLGTTEAFSEWFWDDQALEFKQVYLLSGLNLDPQDVYDAAQTAATGDDFALLETLLSGRDLFNMSHFDDTVRGFGGNDRMFGNAGNDTLMGDTGADRMFGGSENDLLFGGNGNDYLDGGRDDDILRGENGRDVLLGDSGRDKLLGGDGNDVLRGGAGHDKLVGGDGEDLFRFHTGDDKDIIRDFNTFFLGDHDRIDLSGLNSVVGWADLKHNHMTQDGADVVIDGGNGDILILRNVDMDALLKSYFDF